MDLHLAGLSAVGNMVNAVPLDDFEVALEHGVKIQGEFPRTSSNQFLLRDGPGQTPAFAKYDTKTNMPIFRVDLAGDTHGGLPTPHIHYASVNTPPGTTTPIFNKWFSKIAPGKVEPYLDDILVVLIYGPK